MNLHNLLHATGRRLLASQVVCVLFVSLTSLLLAAFWALVLDAVFGLATVGLIVVDLLLVGLLGFLVAKLLRCLRQNQFDPRRVARRIECQLGLADNRLINAVEFRESADHAGSRALIEDAIERGEKAAAAIEAHDAVDYRPMWRWTGVVCACVTFLILAYVLVPLVFARGIVRYLDPAGNHPPFTLVRFQIDVAPEAIYVGSPATIAVELSGPMIPEQADLVFIDGSDLQRFPMLRNDVGKFLFYLENASTTRDFFIDTPEGRSELHRLQVVRIPRLEAVNVTYQFPEYTAWTFTRHALESRSMRALIGSKVEIVASSNVPLRSGLVELLSVDGETVVNSVPLTPSLQKNQTVTGGFVLTQSGRYRLSLTGVDGVAGLESLEGKVVAVPDRAPLIDIVEPEPQLVVVEGWQVPVVMRATDDVKIDQIVLNMSVNGWTTGGKTLLPDSSDGRVSHASWEFDLAELGARAGDVISYYASAYDNHPPDRQFTDTGTYWIQVISLQEYEDLARRNYRADDLEKEINELRKKLDSLQQRRKELLAEIDELRQAMARGDWDTVGSQRWNELTNELKQFEGELQRLTKDLGERSEQQQLYDFEQPYTEMLKDVGGQLDAQSQAVQQLRNAMEQFTKDRNKAGAKSELEQALKDLYDEQPLLEDETQKQIELSAEMLEMFQLVDRMMAATEQIREVIHQQREIADRMQGFLYQDELTTGVQHRLDQLAKQQELLREELEQASEQLRPVAEQAAEKLPKTSGDAMRLWNAIQEKGILADQDTAAEMARSGICQAALDAAELAAQKLESLLSDCCNPEGVAGEMPLDPGLGLSKDQMRNSLNQLSQGRQLPRLQRGVQSGQQGRGAAGSLSRMTVRGPHHEPQGDGGGPGGFAGAQAKGKGYQGGSSSSIPAAESITSDQHSSQHHAAGHLRGVPVVYRDHAEAYFRRLAEEATND